MPNIKSAIKRMRSDERKAARNNAVLSEVKTLSAKLLALKEDPKVAKEFAVKVSAKYDRAASKGVIPKGRANRKKARIAKFVASLEPATKKKATPAKKKASATKTKKEA